MFLNKYLVIIKKCSSFIITKTVTIMKLKLLLLDLTLFLSLVSFTTKSKTYTSEKYSVNKHYLKDVDVTLTVITINKGQMKFSVSEGPGNSDFYLNANFFTQEGNPIGEVVKNGKILNKKIKGGGFFYTINGVPCVSTSGHPVHVDNSVQTKYVGVKNGKLNNSLFHGSLNTSKLQRQIIGKDKNGNIVIVMTDGINGITMKRLSEVALSLGLNDALLFDGGTSLDLKINDNTNTFTFKTLNSFFKKVAGIPEPPIYITGNFKN